MKMGNKQKMKEAYIKANIPDFVKDFQGDCKWQFYMPAGGYEFQKDFDEYWIPYIDKEIKNLVAKRSERRIAREKFKEVMRDMAEARNALITARAYFDANANIKKTVLDNTDIASQFFEKDFEWLETAPEKAHGIWTAMSALGDISTDKDTYASDIEFLNAFRNYFLTDRQFDIAMWLLSAVDKKYRTKLMRLCCRMSKEQMTRAAIIDNAATPLAMLIKGLFAFPLKVLKEGNECTFEAVKYAKKNGGEMAFGSDDELRENLHKQQIGATWGIIR